MPRQYQATQSLIDADPFHFQIDEYVEETCGHQGWVGDISGLLGKVTPEMMLVLHTLPPPYGLIRMSKWKSHFELVIRNGFPERISSHVGYKTI